jgi:hypothetical protein
VWGRAGGGTAPFFFAQYLALSAKRPLQIIFPDSFGLIFATQ